MTPINNPTSVQWLTEHIDWHIAPRPLRLNNFLPPLFDHYRALLWTPGIIDDFPFDDIVFPPQTIEQTNRNIETWRKFQVFRNVADDRYRPTTFKAIAARFGLPYDRQIIQEADWHSRGITTLYPETRKHLERIVDSLGNGQPVTLFVEDHYRWPGIGSLSFDDAAAVLRVTAAEYTAALDETNFDANTYLFPDDRSWCLLGLEDLDFNIIAFKEKWLRVIDSLALADTFTIGPGENLFD